MINFSIQEQYMICLYDPGTREGLINELQEMQKDLLPDEDDLKTLAIQVISKLRKMTDKEYVEALDSMTLFFPPMDCFCSDDLKSDTMTK